MCAWDRWRWQIQLAARVAQTVRHEPMLLHVHILTYGLHCVLAAKFSFYGYPKGGGTSISIVLTEPLLEGDELLLVYPLAEHGTCPTCNQVISMASFMEFPALKIPNEVRQSLALNVKRTTKIQSKRTTAFLDHDKVRATFEHTHTHLLLACGCYHAGADLPLLLAPTIVVASSGHSYGTASESVQGWWSSSPGCWRLRLTKSSSSRCSTSLHATTR